MQIKVEDGNIRIDKYLLNHLDLSRSKIQKLIKNGCISVDGKVISANNVVKENNIITIIEKEEEKYEIKELDISLDIV